MCEPSLSASSGHGEKKPALPSQDHLNLLVLCHPDYFGMLNASPNQQSLLSLRRVIQDLIIIILKVCIST